MGGGKEGRDGHRKSGGRRASHRREEEDGGGGGRRSGGDRASGSGGHSRERSLTGREKGLRESTSWRSESSALEADLGTPELVQGPPIGLAMPAKASGVDSEKRGRSLRC